MFMKRIFLRPKKSEKNKNYVSKRNYVSKYNLYLYFLKQQNLLILGEKILMSAELNECVS